MADRSDAAKSSSKNKSKYKTLGSLLRYFVGQELKVELKTGRIFTGLLTSSDNDMNLSLEDATVGYTARKKRSRQEEESNATEQPHLSIASIRGSTIRYIHFPNRLDLASVVKQGIDREQNATKRYKRATRKAPK